MGDNIINKLKNIIKIKINKNKYNAISQKIEEKKLKSIYGQNTKIIDDYLIMCKNNGIRPDTITLYKCLLMNFSKYCSDNNINLYEVDKNIIYEYIKTKKWSDNTINIFKTVLKSMYKHLSNEIIIPVDPKEMKRVFTQKQIYDKIIDMKMNKIDKNIEPEKAMKKEDVINLLTIAKRRSDMEYNILYILFYFGFRKGEFRKLKVKDIDFDNNGLTIRAENSKTRRARKLFFDDHVKKILLKMTHKKKPDDYVLGFGKRISDHQYINNLMKRYEKTVNCGKLFPHRARHTCNNEFRKCIPNKINGNTVIPDLIVKKIMGHKYAHDMTDRYSSIDEKIIKEAMIKHHWLKSTHVE